MTRLIRNARVILLPTVTMSNMDSGKMHVVIFDSTCKQINWKQTNNFYIPVQNPREDRVIT